ncbi:MAG: hypothetical protein ACREBC_16355 [Pyrinomonadaceae bacterium]
MRPSRGKNSPLTLGGGAGPELQRFDYSYGQTTQATGAVDVTKNNGQIGKVDGFINSVKQPEGGGGEWDGEVLSEREPGLHEHAGAGVSLAGGHFTEHGKRRRLQRGDKPATCKMFPGPT